MSHRSAAEYAHLRRLVLDVRPDPLVAPSTGRLARGGRLLELLKDGPRFEAVEQVVTTDLDIEALRGCVLASVAAFRQQMLDADEYSAFWAIDDTSVFD